MPTYCVRCEAEIDPLEIEEVQELLRKAIIFGFQHSCEGGNMECDQWGIQERLVDLGLKNFLTALDKGEL